MRKLGLAVTGLPNLEYIRIWSCEEIEGIFEEDERRAASIITTLSRLNELRLEDLPRLRKVGLHMQKIPNLLSIYISNCGEIQEIFEQDERRAASIITTTHPKLKELSLINLPRLRKVGLHIQEIPNLESIEIRSCGEIEEIFEEDEGRAASIITTHPKLKELRLRELPRLRKVGLHIQEIPNLESICIWDCGEIQQIFEEDEGRAVSIITTVPKFNSLTLEKLPRLRKVGLHIQEIPNLESIEIWDCGEIEEIFEGDEGRAASVLTRLRRLKLKDLPKLKKVGLHIQEIPNLEFISIDRCGEIKEIFEEDERRDASIITTLPKFKSLSLEWLPRLRKVGLHIQEIPNLELISIWNCGEIEEIFEEDEGRAASVLTRLRKLTLIRLPKLKSVSKPTIISNSITEIQIIGCPRLMNKLPVHIDGPTPPSTLRIVVHEAWWKSLEWDININPNLPRLLQDFVVFR